MLARRHRGDGGGAWVGVLLTVGLVIRQTGAPPSSGSCAFSPSAIGGVVCVPLAPLRGRRSAVEAGIPDAAEKLEKYRHRLPASAPPR